MRAVATLVRFWTYVSVEDGCWPWTGARTKDGYGRLLVGRNAVRAHRLSWEIHYGPIPEGQHVLHSCDNPPCVYPPHLFLGTHADNMADMRAKGRRKGIYTAPRTGYHRQGEANGRHKLTDVQVREMRFAFQAGSSKRALAARYGVSRPSVADAVNGITWRHIDLHGKP